MGCKYKTFHLIFKCLIFVVSRLRRIMKRYILIIILGVLSLCSMAQEKKFIKGFSGGMMAHTGYQFGGDNPYGYNPKGATFGIGGVARLHLSEHFRTGFEGYFSTLGLKQDLVKGSHNKVFWAGALADCFWKVGRFYPYVGATIGGGMETAYYMFAGDSHDWLPEANVVLNKQPFFAVDPFVGCDIAVGEALRLTVKVDWLMAIHHASLNRPMGPRIYFGCIFAH
jgi:hypothetical protein